MSKLNYLNLGCGDIFHPEWVNVDMKTTSPQVISYNLLKGIPFSDNKFDVLYHSQVLEHFPKEEAHDFICECYRVLKPAGIIRIGVPNLENIANEYLKNLREVIEKPNMETEANYDWIMLELYDQTVRNYSGGRMSEFIRQPELINEQYVLARIGRAYVRSRECYIAKRKGKITSFNNEKVTVKKVARYILKKIKYYISSETKRIGAFRLGGEVHLWMYDRYSLSRLLQKAGFVDIEVKTPFKSNIQQWDKFELDVKDGLVYTPTALFMEAIKPSK